jgi:hypothetical protein
MRQLPDSLFQVLNVVNTSTADDLLHMPPLRNKNPGVSGPQRVGAIISIRHSISALLKFYFCGV